MSRRSTRFAFSFTLLGLVLLLPLLFTSTAAAFDWYVDGTGSDGGTGTPGDPFRTISHAIAVGLPSDTIHIGSGTYDAAAGEVFPLVPKPGMRLEGAGADVVSIVGNNSVSVMVIDGVLPSPTIRNVTVTHGFAADGGGVYVRGTPASFFDVIFEKNTAMVRGGGVYVEGAAAYIEHCVFYSNTGGMTGGGGGGLYCNAAAAEVVRCTFRENVTLPGGCGGGACLYDSDAHLVSCLFSRNIGRQCGGGVYFDWRSDAALMERCRLERNCTVENGGFGGCAVASRDASFTMRNCIVFDNDCDTTIDGRGGAILLRDGTEFHEPRIVNNTFTANSAQVADGIYCGALNGPAIFNCILWDGGDELVGCSATFSDVQGGGGGGCIDVWPMFFDPVMEDFSLAPRSPCIDVGVNGGAPPDDFNGGPRPLDGDGDSVTVTDMGAYEYLLDEATIYARQLGSDLTGSGTAANPFRSLSRAHYCAMEGDTCDVGDGSFDENHGEVFPIELKSGVTIRGAGAASTHIVCDSHVGLFHAGSGVTGAEIRSCTLEGGYAHRGGGICCEGGDLDVQDVYIRDCHANDDGVGRGGGICCDSGGEVRCHGIEIGGCTADGRGGGICCDGAGSRCDLDGGRIHDCDGGGGGGGGICYDNDCDGDLDRVTIDHCTTADEGAGIRCDHGASPHIDECHVTQNGRIGIFCRDSCESLIENCTIDNNTNTGWGAGISISENSTCQVVNCAVTHNVSTGPYATGGAWVYNCWTPGGPWFINDTFRGNTGSFAGGLAQSDCPTVQAWNCIFWDEPGAPEINWFNIGAIPVIFSDVRGGYAGAGNIDAEPRFMEEAEGGIRLQATSPCIDVGLSSGAPDHDHDLVSRPQDGDNSGGIGGPQWDMGASERVYLAINAGATHTNDPHVTLTSSFAGAVDMRLGNPGCGWGDWQTYTASAPWTLNIGDGTFEAKADYATGESPYSVAVADFDGDGQQDLATVDNDLSSVSADVLLGDGSGGFAAPTAFATGAYSRAVAVGDFNDDGKPDLVTANEYVNEVRVRLNSSSGGVLSFAPRTHHSTGELPYSVAVGDFDGDGRQDLVTANAVGDSVSVLLGDGSGGFAAKTDNATGDTPYSVAVGDLDGDGVGDLVTANLSGTVSVLLGDGSGGFAAKTDFATGAAPHSVAVGDFDGDGDQDLATANSGSGTVSVLLGDGSGDFAGKADFATGSGPYSVVTSDLNGDGRRDLVTANDFADTASVLIGDGAGGFGAKADLATGSEPCSVAVGDFDEDGRADLVTSNAAGDTASVLLGQGTSDGIKKVQVDYTYATQKGLRTLSANESIVFDSVPPETTDNAPTDWQGIADMPVLVTLDPVDGGGGGGGAAGVAGTWYDIDGAGTWPAYAGPFPIATEGEHTVEYYSTDNVGNVETPHPSATVRIDLTVPEVHQHGADDDPFGHMWSSDDVVVSFHATDSGGSGGPWTDSTSDGGTTWTKSDFITVPAPPDGSNDGVHDLAYRAHDLAGNESSWWACWVRIDTQPPETTDDAPAGWVNYPVTLTLTPDDGRSGVLKTEYRVDGGYWRRGTSVLVAAPPEGTNDGDHTIQYRSMDNAYNIEDNHTCHVRIDTQAPMIGDNADGAWHTDYLLTLSGVDPEGGGGSGGCSGIDRLEYRLDGRDWREEEGGDCDLLLRAWKRGGNTGIHGIEYRAYDNAGNESRLGDCDVLLDGLAPHTTCDAPMGPAPGPLRVTFSATDGHSGVAETWYSLDGAAWCEGHWVDIYDAGYHWIEFYSIDDVGNQETYHHWITGYWDIL
jgi:hypothetical protein